MGGRLQRSPIAVFGLGLAFSLGVGACFIEPAPPPAFRFDCSSDSECASTEVCSDGLCQVACSGFSDDACGQMGVCLNGFCSGVCSLADDQCSDPQVCISLAAPEEEPSDTGICIVKCSEAHPCAEGQICYEDLGLCVSTCGAPEDCGAGEECLGGVCLPSF